MRQKYAFYLLVVCVAACLLPGCDTVRHLEKDQLLLRNKPSYTGAKSLDTDVLDEGVKTKPNRRLILPKVYLGLYNLGLTLSKDSTIFKKAYRKLDKQQYYENTLVEWLTKGIGEPPVLVNPQQIQEDAENLQSIYFGEGFLDATVQARIVQPRLFPQRADVVFDIREGKPYIIDQVYYRSRDPRLVQLCDSTRELAHVKAGERYNESKFAEERARITNVMRDAGYYRFTQDMIRYVVDTTQAAQRDTLGLRKRVGDKTQRQDLGDTAVKRAQRYATDAHYITVEVMLPDTAYLYFLKEVTLGVRKTGEINLDSAYTFQLNSLSQPLRRAYGIDSRWLTSDMDMRFSTAPDVARRLNLNVVGRRVSLHPSQRYSLLNSRRTISQLNELRIFRNNVLTFDVNDSARTLRANIDLVLLRNYAFSAGIEGFLSNDIRVNQNLPGFGVVTSFRNRNLFGRAELLDLDLATSVSFYQPNPEQSSFYQAFYFFTGRLSLSFPSFWLLETPRRNLLRYRPLTSINLSANQEVRREFRRLSTTASWEYQWFNIPFSQRSFSTLTPLAVTLVQSETTADFEALLDSLNNPSLEAFIRRDFLPRISTKAAYYLALSNNYSIDRKHNTWYMRAGAEVGGNIPYLLDVLTRRSGNVEGDIKDNKLGGRYVYGQFLRSSFEFKYFMPTGKRSELVARAFIGGSTGVLNTRIIPYENRFFTGGVNSVRGWQANTLGPGTFRSDTIAINNLIAPGGEFALELNLEYRFKMTSMFHGAFFIDAGNVWFGSGGGFDDPRGWLDRRNLQLGLAAGMGLRIDLSFFIVRFDFGQQLYSPDIQDYVVKRWPRDLGGSRYQFNLGIGYPF